MITDSFPKIAPSLDLNFARAQKLDSRITFSRPSAATYFDRNGILRTAASGVPRFDFDPITGACKGLLIEEQRTNLLTYSEQFDNAAWTKVAASISANAVTAPDGALTADKFVEDTATAAHQLVCATPVNASTAYTFSVFAKNAGRRYLRISFSSGVPFPAETGHIFDLQSGTIYGTPIGSATASITAVGGEWYRCVITATSSDSGVLNTVVRLFNKDIGSTYTGDGTSGIYLWGAQLEAGNFPTSYIKTEAAQATRVADVALMTDTNFSSWYRQDEGTLVAEAQVSTDRSYAVTFRHVALISTASASNSTIGVLVSSVNRLAFEVKDGGNQQANISVGTNLGGINKWAGAYQVNNFALSTNGAGVTTDTSGQAPVSDPPTQIVFGRTRDNNTLGVLNGHISRFAYYPKRLTNTELQALTT